MKLAIYFNHYQTLGHTTRVITLLKGLKEQFGPKVKILIFHSGKKNIFNLKKYGKVIDLPFSLDKRWFNLQLRFRLDIWSVKLYGLENFLKKRLSIMKKELNKFKPDIFISEYYPFGKEFWAFELEFILEFLKKAFNTRIFSSVGYPFFMKDTAKIFNYYYDGVFFHYLRDEMFQYIKFLRQIKTTVDLKELEGFLKKFANKIYYTGYLIEKKRLKEPCQIRKKLGLDLNRKLVVVSRGGGVVRNDIIIQSIKAAKILKKVFFLISAGPATSLDEFKYFKTLANLCNNVRLVLFLENFEDYLNAADLSINMAGYNTIVRLLWLKKQSLTIPLVSNIGNVEQEWRAKLIEKFGLFKVLNEKYLNLEVFLNNIRKMLKEPLLANNLINRLSFEGKENTLKIFKCLT